MQTIETIDDKHVKFNGKIYAKEKGGTFARRERLHQAVYEYYHNCVIPSGYDIHHKDLNKANNDISNLQMLSHAKHHELHAKLRKKVTLTCQYCGKTFKSEIYKHEPMFCSKQCAGRHQRERQQETRICVICGKEFQCDKYQKTQTCSQECKCQLPSVKKSLALGHGWNIGRSKTDLTPEQVLYIRQNYKPRDKEFGIRAMARNLNLTKGIIESIIHHRTYRDID